MQTTESSAAAGRTFIDYCPLHEYERDRCDEHCLVLRKELRLIDTALRVHWARLGLSFFDRGRSR